MLYEVITLFRRTFFLLLIGANDSGARKFQSGNIGGNIRITSYNVCYTKLLRRIKSQASKSRREEIKGQLKQVETGIFAADMQVFSQNDGPVTILLEKEN